MDPWILVLPNKTSTGPREMSRSPSDEDAPFPSLGDGGDGDASSRSWRDRDVSS